MAGSDSKSHGVEIIYHDIFISTLFESDINHLHILMADLELIRFSGASDRGTNTYSRKNTAKEFSNTNGTLHTHTRCK